MTSEHTARVADAVLAYSKVEHDLRRRIFQGATDPDRAIHMMQLASEDIRKQPFDTGKTGTYLLEVRTRWGKKDLRGYATLMWTAPLDMNTLLQHYEDSMFWYWLRQTWRALDNSKEGGDYQPWRLYGIYGKGVYGHTSQEDGRTFRGMELILQTPRCATSTRTVNRSRSAKRTIISAQTPASAGVF